MKTILPAVVFLLAGAGVGAALHLFAARRRRPGGECGDYWARVVLLVVAVLGPALVVSGWLETLAPGWWHAGRHLHLDLTGAFGWPIFACYLAALAAPFAVWFALLGVTLFFWPQDDGRWLAGGVGFRGSRRWVLLAALPAFVAVLFTLPRLGGGPGACPGAAWATLAVLCFSLAGVAGSAGRDDDDDAAAARGEAESADEPQVPWPRAMRDRGIQLRPLVTWPARDARRPLRGTACNLAERRPGMGARRVAPELVEAVDVLLRSRAEGGDAPLASLVLGPDDCGQTEVVSLAADLIHRRYHARTLVITAGDAAGLALRLGRWLGGGGAVAITSRTEIPPRELVWVSDAGTLSDRLLPQLRDPHRAERLGLVVWWDLHDYSGVVAANLWAISRRLDRLLRAHGRPDVRVLALLRSVAYEDAQATRFVRRLLPLPAETPEFRVAPGPPRPVEVHLVESHHGYLTGAGEALAERWQHLPLAAARASAEDGHLTCFDVPGELRDQAEGFFGSLRGTPLEGRLSTEAAEAGARIHKLTDAEVLSLVEILSHGGRAGGGPHHVGLVRPDNPYAAYLLERLAGDGFGTSRRLVSAEARERVIHRHLLLALDELPDTRGGLLRSFLHHEELIGRTLEEIAREGNLTRREVRYLDRHGRLVVDHQYQSRRLGDRTRRPLDTVGVDLVEVRDPTADGDGVCLRLDRERLTIEAYPQRIFLHRGVRYRIGEWSSPEEIAERGWLPCERYDGYALTWRLRHAGLFDLELSGSLVTVGRQGHSFTRRAAQVHYEEEVTGVVRVTPKPSSVTWPRAEIQTCEPIRTSFPTRALLLGLPRSLADDEGPVALCQALRQVLPVHLGVGESDLELVPLGGYESPDGTFGVAVVDLYPGGIGLVEGLQDDDLLAQLLRRTRDWLAACRCRGARGCCLATPGAKAAAMNYVPDHRAALKLLEQVVV